MIEHLFVYGTLGPGRPNAHILEKIGGSFQNADLNGRLHEAGWGAQMGFPGLIIDAQGEKIKGFVFSSENLQQHWKFLDDFEGAEYQRILTPVLLENGQHIQAYAYTVIL